MTGVHVLRCGACGSPTWEDSFSCPSCGSPDLVRTEISGTGTVYSYCSVQVAPTFMSAEAPYLLLMVHMTDGPAALGRWASTVEPRIGMQVSVAPDRSAPGNLWFEPLPQT